MIIERWCKKGSQEGVVDLLPSPSINAGVIQDGGKMVVPMFSANLTFKVS